MSISPSDYADKYMERFIDNENYVVFEHTWFKAPMGYFHICQPEACFKATMRKRAESRDFIGLVVQYFENADGEHVHCCNKCHKTPPQALMLMQALEQF